MPETVHDVHSVRQPEIVDAGEYPDGPVRAWCTVLGAWLVLLCGVGVVNSFGVFQAFYETTWLKNQSASNISWIGCVQLFLELGCGPIGGKLFDAGYFRSTFITGCTLFTFSFFMLSLAEPLQYYQVFLSQGLGMGAGIALIFLPAFAITSLHFKQHRALALGIVGSSAPLGGVIFTILLNQLFNHASVGFVWAIRAAAFLTLGCFILGNALMSVPRKHRNPPKESMKMAVSFAALRDIPFVLTLASGFLASFGTWFPVFYIQVFGETHNLSKTFSFYSLAIMNFACMFGRVVPNYFADRVGTLNVYIPCMALNGLVGFAMLGCGNVTGMVLFSIIYGFFFGSSLSLYLPLVAELLPQEMKMGNNMGLALVPVGIASLVGPPITGAILGPDLVWWKGVTFASVCITAASVLLVMAKYAQIRRKRLQAIHGDSSVDGLCSEEAVEKLEKQSYA